MQQAQSIALKFAILGCDFVHDKQPKKSIKDEFDYTY